MDSAHSSDSRAGTRSGDWCGQNTELKVGFLRPACSDGSAATGHDPGTGRGQGRYCDELFGHLGCLPGVLDENLCGGNPPSDRLWSAEQEQCAKAYGTGTWNESECPQDVHVARSQ